MCGIAGAFATQSGTLSVLNRIEGVLARMALRGPDAQGVYRHGNTTLGHRRLSIIDTSESANQPMTDVSGRYTVVFNGEIFNFQELRSNLVSGGISFNTQSDTEVLLQLYIQEGVDCLSKLNGFFALAIYDRDQETIFLARDRMGIKPLYYAVQSGYFCFASEIKALQEFGIPSEIDPISLELYFSLNYVPGPWSMLKGIQRLQPGHYIMLSTAQAIEKAHPHEIAWYKHEQKLTQLSSPVTYEAACTGLYERMEEAVRSRLIADVPLGAFLSGGIDSSIVVALAAKAKNGLHTYSIGFSDEPHFDETKYAEEVARHCGTRHRTFKLKTQDLLHALPEVTDYFGEPFADSSALAVYILSKETRKEVTVALSGDGGDELFAGYRKHKAEWLIRNRPLSTGLASVLSPAMKPFKGSRQSVFGNRLRQLHRLAEGAGMNDAQRYWRWCSIASAAEVQQLLVHLPESVAYHRQERINQLTRWVNSASDFNRVLLNDSCMVLPDDMLVKVDQMSMANSLEVRVPFLDYRVVEWAFSLPAAYKIDAKRQKKMLRDTFGKLVPESVFTRAKKGFEVPLLRWLKQDLNKELDQLFDHDLLASQGIFNPHSIAQIRKQLHSNHPGDATARVWALYVFQKWWMKNFNN